MADVEATATPRLPWPRFWCPRTGKVPVVDGGYVVAPDSELSRWAKGDVVAFADIGHIPCLALLGEPGIGKSTALRQEVRALKETAAARGDAVHHLDLRAYGSEVRLVRDVFEDPAVAAWRAGNYVLHLVLDSLDECLLRVSTVADLLLDELQRRVQDVNRLRLRIACRTAEWPANLAAGLVDRWGEDGVGTYELVPLTFRDVRAAAVAYGVDDQEFFSEVRRVSATPLAVKPVTLHFLLKSFRRDGRLPPTQNSLYLEGCRLLCEETSSSRRGAALRGSLGSNHRLAVAARIAAATVFCNRPTVRTGVGDPSEPAGEIDLRLLAGGTEPAGVDLVAVDEAAVREALGTGLFTSRGPERLGFAHQTYAEFLAAHYVSARGMATAQALSLVMHADDPGRVIPQLGETAAWLAGMSPPVFDAVMRGDPLVLLRSDVASASDARRAQVVESMLRLFADGKLMDDDLRLRQAYARLRHPTLRAQLEPVIRDRSASFVVRRLAIDLAEACGERGLQSLLADVALDSGEAHHVRVKAAHAVVEIGDSTTRLRLRPLAEGRGGQDPDDELKGCGLRALWPDLGSVAEVLPLLTPQKKLNLHGAYSGFLGRDLPQGLSRADLPTALAWLHGRPLRHDLSDRVGQFGEEVLRRAWEHCDDPAILDLFAEAVPARLREHVALTRRSEIFRTEPLWSWDDPNRLRLVEALVPRLEVAGNGTEAVCLFSTATPVLRGDDLRWLVGRLRSCPSKASRRLWATLVRFAFPWRSPTVEQVELMLDAVAAVPELDEEVGTLFRPVDLASEAAELGRAALRDQRRLTPPEPPLLDPPPRARVAAWLARFEAGEADAWWMVNREMTLGPRSTHYGDEAESDLTALPGWLEADAPTRSRIVSAARRYLDVADPRPNDWMAGDDLPLAAAAGYRALVLLHGEHREAMRTVGAHVWGKWAPVILRYAVWHADEDAAAQEDLVRACHRAAAEELIDAVLAFVDAGNAAGRHLWVLQKVDCCWDDRLHGALAGRLARGSDLKPSCLGDLLKAMIRHGSDAARSFARSLVTVPPPPPTDEPGRTRSLTAARALVEHADGAGWDAVWAAVESDADWGDALLGPLAQRFDHAAGTLTSALTADQAAGLYAWLVEHYPPAEDPEDPPGMGIVTARRSMTSFRDGVLSELVSRGSPESMRAVERLARRMPGAFALIWGVIRARRALLQQTWIPPDPDHVVRLASDPGSRLVESGDQLLDVVVESLRRWERKLQGTPPAAFGLWDEVAKNRHRPKIEDKLSDAAAIHLAEDLRERMVVVNREVVIRRGEKPGGVGERTDIHVEAPRRGHGPGATGTVRVVVEAKGCWHDEVGSAMESQLRDRYLRDNECRHGLFLVGWYACPQWDPDDPRRGATPAVGQAGLQSQLAAQAEELSVGGVVLRALVINAVLR